MKKILVIRFSSIGDIILTSPVVRCLRQQLPGTQVHFVTKEAFAGVLRHNPNIDKLYTFTNDVEELYASLRAEKYDCVIDLHKNLRSLRLKRKLGVKSYSFHKLNVEKLLAVRLKTTRVLPAEHIVERYLDTLKELGVHNDGKGLDYFIHESEEVNVASDFFKGIATRYIALVAGGSYFTKQIPLAKLREVCRNARLPIVILGGKADKALADQLQAEFENVVNACGSYTISQSASIIRQAEWVISPDTGLMHVAAAFNKKIVSVWGNTVPEFGMGPYLPNAQNKLLEVKDLSCRPCSKLGYKKCPKGHFKCMNDIDFSFVKELF